MLDEIKRLAEQGWWSEKIARYLSIQPSTLTYHLKRHNIVCQRANCWNTKRKRKVMSQDICACGCGLLTNPGNRYRHGHNMTGTRMSEETRKRCSEIQRNRKQAFLVYCGWCFKPLRKALWEMTNSDGSTKKHHYCDLVCSGKHNGELHKGENSHCWKGGMETKSCEQCGKQITRYPANFRGMCFCDYDCEAEWKRNHIYGPFHPQWQGGLSFQEYCSEWKDGEYKRDIKARDREICFLCGSENKLCVHHIDYNKKNCRPTNLITLCNTCNARVNWNRESWQSYFETMMCMSLTQRLSFAGVMVSPQIS